MPQGPDSEPRLTRCYRACDVRYPFLWADDSQRPGRWHVAGEGPCHYLSTTAKGAWAEVLRHEEIHDLERLLDLEVALWEVHASVPTAEPELDREILTGGLSSYPACQGEAHRLRDAGHSSLRAPAAALLSGQAELYGVVEGSQVVTDHMVSENFVFIGPPNRLVGMPLAEGHPDPALLGDVRHL